MKALTAFIEKEFMEFIRTGKLAVLLVVFILFGIMNPAIAMLTPQLMNVLSDSLAESGISVVPAKIDAMDSWVQFYKNAPILMIIFLIIISGIMTAEYQKGTLINMVTKGLARVSIILAKLAVAMILWTMCYWIGYIITYGYSAYFWDNSIVCNLGFSAFCVYLIGIWLITLIFLMSVFFNSNTSVLAAAGGVFVIVYIIGMAPKVSRYLPVQLMASSELMNGQSSPGKYLWAVIITAALSGVNIVMAVAGFNKKLL